MFSRTCVHSGCAVCKQLKDREFFKSILQTSYPDVFLCEHAMYKIVDCTVVPNPLYSLDGISKGKNGYFIQDMYSARPIYLDKQNVVVLCSKSWIRRIICKRKSPHVSEYIPKQEKAAD